jgi:uncharacterized membrane protein
MRSDRKHTLIAGLKGNATRVGGKTLALAAAELLGDKMRSAADRIITPGILARIATGAISGTAVASPPEPRLGAALGATAAVAAAYLTLALRKQAIRDRGEVGAAVARECLCQIVFSGKGKGIPSGNSGSRFVSTILRVNAGYEMGPRSSG